MTSSQTANDDLTICPNCKAVNFPNLVICVSCGVRLDTYEEVNQRWIERESEKKSTRINEIKGELDQFIQCENKRSSRAFLRQAGILVVATLLLSILAWGIVAFINYRQHQLILVYQAEYDRGKICYQQKNYLCARDTFASLYKKDNDFQDIKKQLINAKNSLALEYIEFGQTTLAIEEMESILKLAPAEPDTMQRIFDLRYKLAEQYTANGHWDAAVDELELALLIKPNDPSTLMLLKHNYEQLYQNYLQDGYKVKAWWLKKLMNDRFR